MMDLSRLGNRFARPSGIAELMEDLGRALAGEGRALMLGGGNPAHIEVLETLFRAEVRKLADEPDRFARAFGDYSPPQGDPVFIESLAGLMSREYGFELGPENIALTSGSQISFFILFNLFAGDDGSGLRKKVLLPLCPEYVGYANLCAEPDGLMALRPAIDLFEPRRFKYRASFEDLDIGEDIGAVCLSRPTNPSGNVVSDRDLERLAALTRSRGIPLIVDGAYGLPFPDILFRDARLFWDESIVLSLSLSKLGLPGVRTGIVVARPEIITAVARMNAILALAPGGIGPAVVHDLVRNGAILRLARDVIRPYYAERLRMALDQLSIALEGLPYRVHEPEGAMFLWLWFPELPITSRMLYSRLKERRVLCVPGEHFFPGLQGHWRHTEECIRIHYARPPEVLARGLAVLAEELRRAYD